LAAAMPNDSIPMFAKIFPLVGHKAQTLNMYSWAEWRPVSSSDHQKQSIILVSSVVGA
jgi:hypothetical protein